MRYLLLIALVPLLFSCKTTAFYNNINQLQKGDSFDTASQKIDAKHKSNTVTADGKNYKILSTKIITSYASQSVPESDSIRGYNPTTGNYDRPTNRNKKVVEFEMTDFYLMFESDSLFYWGFLYELKRNPDNKIRKIAQEIEQVN